MLERVTNTSKCTDISHLCIINDHKLYRYNESCLCWELFIDDKKVFSITDELLCHLGLTEQIEFILFKFDTAKEIKDAMMKAKVRRDHEYEMGIKDLVTDPRESDGITRNIC